MNPETAQALKRIFARETTSLLQYLREAWPWTSAGEQDTVERLKQIIAEEQQAARGIADFLARRRISVEPGRLPEEFTATNYLALDHLLPRLVANEQSAIAELEQDLGRLTEPEAQAVVRPILDLKRGHLRQLERLAADHAGAKAVSTIR